MRFSIQVTINDEQGESKIQEVICLDKQIGPNTMIGLSLSESKEVLHNLQKIIVQEQAANYTKRYKNCPHCQRQRSSKGYHTIQYKTLFGIISIPSLRVNQCQCHESTVATTSILTGWLSEHTSPELQYIEAKWGSLMAYGQTAHFQIIPNQIEDPGFIMLKLSLILERNCSLISGKISVKKPSTVDLNCLAV